MGLQSLYVDTTNHQAQSGLTPMLDAITGSLDNYANARATLRGVGPALVDAGIPINVPGPSILSRLISTIGGGLDGSASPTGPAAAPPQPQVAPGQPNPSAGSSLPAFAAAGTPGSISPNIQAALSYFTDKGLSPVAAQGLVGGFSRESGPNLDPNAVNKGSGASGIAQWLGSRSQGLQQFAQATGRSPNDFKTQLDYVWSELNGPERGTLAALKGATNPLQATVAALGFERPEGWSASNPIGAKDFGQRLAATVGLGGAGAAAAPGGGGMPGDATAYAPSGQGAGSSPAGRAIAAAAQPQGPGSPAGPFGDLSGAQAALGPQARVSLANAPNSPLVAPSAAAGGPMPQATADQAMPGHIYRSPQAVAASGPQALGAAGNVVPGGQAQSSGAPAEPHEVIQPLMQNPQTQPIGAKLWQGALQQGKMGGQLALPAGMSAQSLAAMISEPQTQALGLAIWQKALSPQITSVEPGRAVFAGTRYIGQSPSGPITAHAGDVIVNPNSGATIAAVPPELQHTEIGRDAYGQPTYGSFNPQGGGVRPFPGGQSAASTGIGPDGQPLTGDAFLSTLPPQIAGQVKAIADGRVRLPTGMGANSPILQRVRAAVLQYDPSFDQAGVDARFETRADFAKGDAAKTITAGNTALIHLGELSDLADKLGNYDSAVPGNNALNWLKNNANSSSAAGAALAAFNATASKYVEEATKFYRGTGGTEGDISRDLLNISPNMSPTQLKAAIQAQIPLLQGKASALQGRWQQGMGPQAGAYPIFSPQAQSVISKIGQSQAPGSGASALPVVSPAHGGRGGQSPDGIPLLTDPSQMQALPPGTRFRTPDGQIRVRH